MEMRLFVDLKTNPFIFDQIPLLDTMFYVDRIYTMYKEKFENMDTNGAIGELIKRLL